MTKKQMRQGIIHNYHRWKNGPNSDSYCVSGANPTEEQREKVKNAKATELEHLLDLELSVERLVNDLKEGYKRQIS